MTELENNIPSVYIIIPLAGVPGFPQDTAVNKRLKKIYQNFHDRWLTGKKKKETSFNSSSFKKAIASFTKKMFNRCILDLISYFCLLIWSLYLLFFFFLFFFQLLRQIVCTACSTPPNTVAGEKKIHSGLSDRPVPVLPLGTFFYSLPVFWYPLFQL